LIFSLSSQLIGKLLRSLCAFAYQETIAHKHFQKVVHFIVKIDLGRFTLDSIMRLNLVLKEDNTA